MGEKTEKATPKKLKDAKKKGQVAKVQDLPAAFTFVASIALILAMSNFLYHQFADFTVETYKLVNHPDMNTLILNLFVKSIEVIFIASIPVLLVVSMIGVLINFLSIGPVFSTEVFKFDIKKFNPVENLKSKFKLKTLVELLKSIIKITIAGFLVYQVVYDSIPVLIQTVSIPMSSALLIFNIFLVKVVLKVGLLFIIIATADFIYQKKNFANEMKMEKFEIKQEYKNTEGDPLIKSKRRQVAQEIAYQEGPSGGVKRAQAVVTNPTHLAVAIGYEKDIDAAPYILAMGKDELASRIIKLADEYQVPVIRNIPLAHILWEEGEIYEFVPEESYEALVEVLQWVHNLKTA